LKSHSPQVLQWPPAPAKAFLSSSHVQVWAASLQATAEDLETFTGTLSPTEAERVKRFRFEPVRRRFIAARGLLRAILARCLQADPCALAFEYGALGKPRLAGAWAGSGVHFNLAHSADVALVAVTRTGEVGVDVEEVRVLKDADELVQRFFSAREQAAFRVLPEEQKPLAFFNLWTRKEAWLKATGEGIGRWLSAVEVSFLPGEPSRLLSLPAQAAAPGPWMLRELVPAEGYVGAVAVAAPNIELNCWRWMALP
jgi:4'-phosphopantetheinyl transferase